MTEIELLNEIRNEKNIIVYGAKDTAKKFIKRMKCLDINIKDVVVSDKSKNEIEVEGYIVKNLAEIENINNCAFIIATSEIYFDEIKKMLNKKGAKKIYEINHKLLDEIDRMNCILANQTRNILLQYNNHNYDKVQRVREKIKIGKKLKVLFLVSDSSKFCSESLYWEMKKSEYFEPTLGLVWDTNVEARGVNNFNRDYKELNDKGFNMLSINTITAIDDFYPDIIIYHSHYLNLGISFVNYELLNYRYLTCHIPYGIELVKNPNYHFNDFCINSSWISFSATDFSYKLNQENSISKGINAVSVGYPKLDNYAKITKNKSEKKKIIIIAPHWSIRCFINFATFELYFNLFEKIRNKYKDYFFVFKPHPTLEYRIKEIDKEKNNTKITYDAYVEYCKRWNESENGIVLEGTNYIEWFKESTCLITDCGSFIGEYLPSGHPCIYLFNPDLPHQMDLYYEIGQDILNSYYICNSESEIERTFEDVVINGNDAKAVVRKEVLSKYFKNIGNSGKKIYEYILKQLTD